MESNSIMKYQGANWRKDVAPGKVSTIQTVLDMARAAIDVVLEQPGAQSHVFV